VRFGESTRHSSSAGGEGPLQTPLASFQEPHYTVAEIAELWKLSRDVVREIFQGEPGVLVIGRNGSGSKRGYHTLRVPESVLARVHRRSCNSDLTLGRSRAYSAIKSGPPVVGNN
jgi:hypothetical protein